MFSLQEQTMCQMSVTKHHSNWGISEYLYIGMSNLCNLVTRYTYVCSGKSEQSSVNNRENVP